MEVKQLICQMSQNTTKPAEQKRGSTVDCRTTVSTGDVVPLFHKSEKMVEVGAFCEVTKGIFALFFFLSSSKRNVQTKQRFQQETEDQRP